MNNCANKKFYVLASVILFLSALFDLVYGYGLLNYNVNFNTLVFFFKLVAVIVLAVFLLIKKQNGVYLPIILGVIAFRFLLIIAYDFIGLIIFYADYVDEFVNDYSVLNTIFNAYVNSLFNAFLLLCGTVFALIISILLIKGKNISKKLAFVPIAIFAIAFFQHLSFVFVKIIDMQVTWLNILSTLSLLTFGVGITLLTFAVLNNCDIQEVKNSTAQTPLAEESISFEEFDNLEIERKEKEALFKIKEIRIDLIIHALLLIFTSPIWDSIWIYKCTKLLNEVKGEQKRSPVCQLLLCLFVPFYAIYWVYKTAVIVENLAVKLNVSKGDVMVLAIIFQFVLPVASYLVIQDKLNQICDKIDVKYSTYYNKQEEEQKTFTNVNNNANSDEVSLLTNYKKLLDDGVITQEEFDKKKNEILNK